MSKRHVLAMVCLLVFCLLSAGSPAASPPPIDRPAGSNPATVQPAVRPATVQPAVQPAVRLVSSSVKSDLKLIGPDEPVEPGDYAQITVEGITPATLPKAQLIHWPRKDVNVLAAQSWGGLPFVLVRAKQPGEYLICVCVPSGQEIARAEYVLVVKGVKPPDPPNPPSPLAAWGKWIKDQVESSLPPGPTRVEQSKNLAAALRKTVAASAEGAYPDSKSFREAVRSASHLALVGDWQGWDQKVDTPLTSRLLEESKAGKINLDDQAALRDLYTQLADGLSKVAP